MAAETGWSRVGGRLTVVLAERSDGSILRPRGMDMVLPLSIGPM